MRRVAVQEREQAVLARGAALSAARVPTQEQHAALRLPTGLPVPRTLRVVPDDAGRPVEAGILVKAGHLCALEYAFA